MLSIEPRHKQMLLAILANYPYTFYAFGSRANATNTPFSDLDLCYLESIPDPIRYQIEEELDQSNLPFIVDLVSWQTTSDWFKESIKNDLTDLVTEKKVYSKPAIP